MIKSQFLHPLQAAHQFQGTSNDCAAISIAMACNVFQGTEINGYDLGQEVNGFIWRGIFPIFRRIPNNAMMPWGMTDAAKELGLKAKWKMFQDEDRLKDKLAEEMILLPVIGKWNPLWAHVMPLVAYDEDKGWGFVNPATKTNKIYFLPEKNFRQNWKWSANMLIEIEKNQVS